MGRVGLGDPRFDGSRLAPQPPHSLPQVFVRRVRVDDRGQRTRVSSEPLRQEKVPRSPVHIRDRRVPKRMEGVEAVEVGGTLPECATSHRHQRAQRTKLEQRPGRHRPVLAARGRRPRVGEECLPDQSLHRGHCCFQLGAFPVHLRIRIRILGECLGAALPEWQSSVVLPQLRQ